MLSPPLHDVLALTSINLLMRITLIPLLSSSALAALEADGCWKPIPASSISVVGGSDGYTVACPGSDYYSLTAHDESGPFTHLKRKPTHFHSFLQTDKTDPSVINVCMTGSLSSQMTAVGYAEVTLSGPFVIRGADFSPSPVASFNSPTAFTVNARAGPATDAEWYASQPDADSGTPWTKLTGSTGSFDTDLAGQFVRIVPAVSTPSASGNGFGAKLYGCSVAETMLISFRFKSSRSAIVTRFGKLSLFIRHLTEHVCMITKFSPTPALCPRILFADLVEDTNSNPAPGAIAPSVLPTVEVFFRVLPADPSSCTDCRSAENVQQQLVTALNTAGSSEAAVVQAIDVWIEDADPYTCYGKVCQEGSLCVNGVCVTPFDLVAQQSMDASTPVQFLSGGSIDQILNLSPLNVIANVDQTAGILSFATTPVKAGAVQSVQGGGSVALAAEAQPVSTSTESDFIKRFLIPIVAGSAAVLIILVLIGFKLYERRMLTPEVQEVTA